MDFAFYECGHVASGRGGLLHLFCTDGKGGFVWAGEKALTQVGAEGGGLCASFFVFVYP